MTTIRINIIVIHKENLALQFVTLGGVGFVDDQM